MGLPVSDTERAIHHEPNRRYPRWVKIQLHWEVDGHTRVRTELISADQFFGLGNYGAPIDGGALIGRIENMRREGPPAVEQKGKKNGVSKARR
jgi:hypothetical protein